MLLMLLFSRSHLKTSPDFFSSVANSEFIMKFFLLVCVVRCQIRIKYAEDCAGLV